MHVDRCWLLGTKYILNTRARNARVLFFSERSAEVQKRVAYNR